MGAMTPVQALLASGVISGAASLGSGIYASNSAAANNSTALAFNKWSQLNAQEFQRSMYNTQKLDQIDFYKKYQSPQAIAEQLAKLGVNPAGVFSQGSGINTVPASMPSGISSPALSAPHLENEGKAMAESIQAIGSSLASIAQAGQSNEQSAEYIHSFNERVTALMLQNEGKKFANNFAQWNLIASQVKLPYEIQSLAGDAYVDFTQGDVNLSLAKLNKIAAYVRDNLKDIDIQYGNELLRLIGEQILDVNAAKDLKLAQTKTEGTVQSLNRASAKNQLSQSKESDTRRLGQEFTNSILKIDSENASILADQKLFTLRSALEKDNAISEKDKTEALRELEVLNRRLKLYQDHPGRARWAASVEQLNDDFPVLGRILGWLK